MNTFVVVNQSCYRRQEEITMVRRFLFVNGFAEEADPAKTDLVLFFTCAFCKSRVADMVQEIGRIRSVIREGCELIVGSCLPEIDGAELEKVFEGKTITPTDFGALNRLAGISVKFEEMPDISGKDPISAPLETEPPRRPAWKNLPPGGVAPMPDVDKGMGVFIASGCVRKCSYCAIRFATGPLRSKPLDVVARTFSEGIELGYRKFEIHADSIGDYGLDIGTNIGSLFDWLLYDNREFSVGIYDLHPQGFIKYFSKILSLCKAGKIHYLHVPLQSGNPRILKLMNRPCDVGTLLKRLAEIRGQKGVFLQSGIIVGFPGESDAEFEDTLSFLKAAQFNDVYVHFYSDMPNTESSKLPDKIDRKTMLKRLNLLEAAEVGYDRGKTLHELESIPLSCQ